MYIPESRERGVDAAAGFLADIMLYEEVDLVVLAAPPLFVASMSERGKRYTCRLF
jgi:hypothetical protein